MVAVTALVTGLDEMIEPLRATQVFQEFRRRIDTGHQQLVSGSGARNIEQMTLRDVYLLKIYNITAFLDALLSRDDLVVTGLNRNTPKLKS